MTPDVNSPPKLSVETNFRELDEAFLQTQTRIWLGEVLQIRLDDETDISDILADGKLLSELSEVLSMMLPRSSIDAHQSKANELKSFVSSKSTSKYMPYYKVGSFLKMCKTLGLDGIDLFTPSDVVEKRNTRKVCICIRSLSKRARSRNLNVPDFDNVTCTLTMPTNKVEFIRKSLEMSQSSSLLSDVLEVERVSSIKYKSRMASSASTVTSVSNEDTLDICDDAESSLTVGEVNGPSDHACDAESSNMSPAEVVGDYSSALTVNMRNVEADKDDQCEYMSPSNAESVGSPSSQYFSDQDIRVSSSDYLGSHISGNVTLNSGTKPTYRNVDLLHIPIEWEDVHDLEYQSDGRANNDEFTCLSPDTKDTARFENPTHPSEIESKKSSSSSIEQASFIDSISSGENIDVAYDLFLEEDFGSRAVPIARDDQVIGELSGHKKIEGGDISNKLIVHKASEVSETENIDSPCDGENFMPQFYNEGVNGGENYCCDSLNVANNDLTSILTEQSSCSVDVNANSCESSSLPAVILNVIDDPLSFKESDSSMAGSDRDTFDANKISLDHTEESSGLDVKDLTASRSCTPQSNSSAIMELTKDRKTCSDNSREICAIPEDQRPLDASHHNADALVPNSVSSGSIEDTSHKCLQGVEDIEKGKTVHIKQEDAAKDVPKHKPGKKLLKTVVKGTAATALLGAAVFLLHARKSRQENVSRLREQPVEVPKQRTPAPLSKKGQKGSKTSSVYPAEKLSFGF